MSLPAWVTEKHPDNEYDKSCVCVMCKKTSKLIEALSIAWEALEKNVELNMRDAEGPELRAQNEGNYRRSKEAMRRIEKIGK